MAENEPPEIVALAFALLAIGLVEVIVMCVSIPVNIVIIFLSFTKVAPSLARTYTMNISIVVLLHVIYSLIYLITHFEDSEIKVGEGAIEFVFALFYEFLRSFTLNVYYFQATLTVVLSYIAFARPTLAMNILSDRNITMAFALGYLLATFTAVVQVLPEMTKDGTAKSVSRVLCGSIQLLVIGLMAVCYARALHHIFVTMRAPDGQSKLTRKALRAMLIYCTPPNLLLVVAFPDIVCHSYIDSEDSSVVYACTIVTLTAGLSQNVR
ncbi:hypothetical protein QR680_016602 [Steinernema hermaphroditum]|uniref:Uncharacterized protein n=1 Tax=Steinernema hermaphroditum TaxID=289476 RepID=A0AA39HCQ2_9BILA|nr:hypothetical protein QR680_016602 [Steinernema hermaphroditum]